MSQQVIYDHRENVISAFVADPDGRVGWIKRMNLRPLVEGLHYHRNHVTQKKNLPWRKIAEMPETVVDQAIRQGWLHDKQQVRSWVNDPDNRAFKYSDERL